MSCHEGILCDFCLAEEFRVKRYKCRECFSYDLCHACFEEGKYNKDHHPSHPMLCMLTQSQYAEKYGFLKALVNASSYGHYEDVYFDIPDIVAEKERPKADLMTIAATQTKRKVDNLPEQEPTCISSSLTDNLLKDFGNLLLDESSCDVTFNVKGKTLRAHKTILTARCPAFSRMFQSNMSESSSGSVCIEDFEPDVVQTFFAYLYTAKVTADDLKRNVTSLFEIADKYLVDDLKEMCADYMQNNINTDSFCDILFLALKCCHTDLMPQLKAFLSANVKCVIRTQKWKDFIRENPEEANDMLIAALENFQQTQR